MLHSHGFLPYFLLYTSLSAVIHSFVCYLAAPSTSLRYFSGPAHPPPTLLLAHVYGTKNIYTAAIRAYAAFYIDNKALYDLAILTFVGVQWLLLTELLVYRTIRWKEGSFAFVSSGVGLVWMVSTRTHYVG